MKKFMYSEMNSLGSALENFLQSDGANLRSMIKNTTLFKFWGKVVGKKFENVSKPVSLSQKPDGAVLNVACANSSVTSELTLYKSTLIKKMNTYANPLCIEICDINFSHKIWESENPKSYESKVEVQEENPYKEDLTGYNPEEIEIPESEIAVIKENISKNKALSDEQQQRLLNSIISDLKIQKFKSLI